MKVLKYLNFDFTGRKARPARLDSHSTRFHTSAVSVASNRRERGISNQRALGIAAAVGVREDKAHTRLWSYKGNTFQGGGAEQS